MTNPTNPVQASFPIPPPVAALGLVEVRGGIGYLTSSGWEFLQKLWAAIQGGGGVLDQVLLGLSSPGITSAAVESILAERLGLYTPYVPRRPYEPIVRYQGDLSGAPTAAQELFNLVMVGDEHFPAGLGRNFGRVGTAPTGAVTFPIKVNGVQVGTMNVAGGATVATWTMANAYDAAAGDLFAFYAPTAVDATLASPSYTFVGKRS